MDPIETILSRGHLYDRAARGPASTLILIGATAIAMAILGGFTSIVLQLLANDTRSLIPENRWEMASWPLLIFVVSIFLIWLIKVWRNYFAKHQAADLGPDEGDEDDA